MRTSSPEVIIIHKILQNSILTENCFIRFYFIENNATENNKRNYKLENKKMQQSSKTMKKQWNSHVRRCEKQFRKQ